MVVVGQLTAPRNRPLAAPIKRVDAQGEFEGTRPAAYPHDVSAAATQVDRPATPPSPSTTIDPRLNIALIINLVAEVLIVVTGGVVRLTKSGLGCPTWPTCTPESMIPVPDQAEGLHKFIEFGNRMLTGMVSVAAILVIVAVWRFAADRTALKRIAWLPLAGVALQAIIGGITVRMKLSPVTVSLHFLASMVLVAFSAYLLVRAREGDAAPTPVVPAIVRQLGLLTAGLGAVILVLGTVVTGTGPHSGDAKTHRFDFDPRTVSWLHADAVMLFIGLVVAVYVATRLIAKDTAAPRAWGWVLLVTLAQGVIGYVQYATKLPELLVLLHMLGASLLVIALTFGVLSLRRR